MIDGAESEIRDIHPAACRNLFETLDRSYGGRAGSLGFRHAKTGAYLLVIKRPDLGASRRPSERLRDAAMSCPRLVMAYDSTTLVYDVTVDDARPGRAGIRLRGVEQGGEPVIDMLVVGKDTATSGRLIRVMTPARIGKVERRAVDVAVARS
ncbi:hypothetical protein HUT19_28610 [Streptomyces sp. NA02950]|uniref:hypothetical protein n=1 Tax=Streptomyces sp. NA02950 TaxID=2742137 RepID=UPI001592A980|nr:hypothetical protein [Streptomyces sp. NA02950]QKV95208.1 hypothetical protein HUT19_28610 [Streptomyces sp. NA02950]